MSARFTALTFGVLSKVKRTTLRLNAPVVEIKHTFLRLEFLGEELVELLGAAHLDDFENHFIPGHDGEHQQKNDDDLRLWRGALEDIDEFRFGRNGPHDGKQ